VDGLSRNAHLFLTVWDYDVTNDDDLIGTAILPLSAIFQVLCFSLTLLTSRLHALSPQHFQRSKGRDMVINLDLLRSGQVQGRIEAKLELLHFDENKPVTVKKAHRSLYDSLQASRQNEVGGGGHKLHSGEAGCGCTLS
jgi:hypothetical protein